MMRIVEYVVLIRNDFSELMLVSVSCMLLSVVWLVIVDMMLFMCDVYCLIVRKLLVLVVLVMNVSENLSWWFVVVLWCFFVRF